MEPEKLNDEKMTQEIIGKQPNTYTATKVIGKYNYFYKAEIVNDHSSNIIQNFPGYFIFRTFQVRPIQSL